MPLKENQTDDEVPEVDEEECVEQHVADLDAAAKLFLTTFTTIRSKIDDLSRAHSDLQRFELSLEAERKRLQKNLESAKLSLRNARIQMGAELAKTDPAGFTKIDQLIREHNSNA